MKFRVSFGRFVFFDMHAHETPLRAFSGKSRRLLTYYFSVCSVLDRSIAISYIVPS